ncbi:MAG: ABC transporter permease, partial [Cytophagaceae bacterium]|nr:ABC transporter permease [Gemmatimonadaceae bacterium]
LLARAATLPSVAAIAAADYPPLGRRSTYRNATPLDDGARTPTMVAVTEARAGLPAAYGVRVVAGRDMTAEEQRRGDRVTVVSEETARRLWGASNPLGRSIRFAGTDSLPYAVVGVVANVRYWSLRGPADAWAILSENGRRHRDATQLVVRTRGDVAAGLAAVQRLVREADPNLAIMSVSTMQSLLWERTDESRALSATLGLFGSLALLLASMGLYGVTAYAVAQRRREIGVRLAIGATPGTVVRELVHDGVRLASVGMIAGAILAIMGWLLARSMLYGIGMMDGLTVFVAATVQVVTVGLAVWLAARRAARYDPAMVLRVD